MKTKIVLTLGLALSATVLAAGSNREGEPGARQARASQSETRQLSRKQAVYELVLKWGPEAARMQTRSVHEWASSMVPLFGTADIANLNKAVSAKSYTDMVNALTGTRAPSVKKLAGGVTPMSLGSMTEDLVYTPLPSCVIVNTTKPGSGGTMTAGGARNFLASGTSFVSQGGQDSNCGIPSGVRALLVNVTSAPPSTSGYFRLWPFAAPEPLAANISYTSGQLIQNEIVLAVSTGLGADFTVRSTGNSHLIINVLGYFAAPLATALECAETAPTTIEIAAGAGGSVHAPACPAGWGMTATYCYGDFGAQTKMSTMYSTGDHGYCVYQNGNVSAITVGAKTRCCRVPGR
jgi:hypothetical protein